MKLVMIDWFDSFGCSKNWEDLDDCEPYPARCRSVGFLLYDGEDYKVVVPHVSLNSEISRQGCGDMTIPTVSIIKITDLKNPEDPGWKLTKEEQP